MDRKDQCCDEVPRISYSQFMNGLKKANIALDRKVLSDLAYSDPKTFGALVEQIKG